MRKFRFVGDPKEYGYTRGLYFGNIYPIDFKPYSSIGNTIEDIFNNEVGGALSRPDWQEVTDGTPSIIDTTNHLHKDTDLGYFAGLAMQGILANEELRRAILMDATNEKVSGFEAIEREAIRTAKELIKQLNEETK